MTEAFAPSLSRGRAPDLGRASGYLVVDARGRLVGRVEGPTLAGPRGIPELLTVSWGFLWLRRCLVAAGSIERIDDGTKMIGLRVERQALRAGRA